MPAPMSCSVCARPDRDAIDAAMRQGTSDRALAKRFGVGRTALRNHRTDHVTGLGRTARPNAQGGRPRNGPALPDVKLVELEAPDSVMAQYVALYAESRQLLEQAKVGGDLLRIQQAIGTCADVLDRFAKRLGLFGDGASVTVDARTIRIDGSIPADFMREYIAAVKNGDPVPELPVHALAIGGAKQ